MAKSMFSADFAN